jgi:hypothetical protein
MFGDRGVGGGTGRRFGDRAVLDRDDYYPRAQDWSRLELENIEWGERSN